MDDWSGIGDDIRAALERAAVARRMASETRRTSEEIRKRNTQLRQTLKAQLRGGMTQQSNATARGDSPADESDHLRARTAE